MTRQGFTPTLKDRIGALAALIPGGDPCLEGGPLAKYHQSFVEADPMGTRLRRYRAGGRERFWAGAGAVVPPLDDPATAAMVEREVLAVGKQVASARGAVALVLLLTMSGPVWAQAPTPPSPPGGGSEVVPDVAGMKVYDLGAQIQKWKRDTKKDIDDWFKSNKEYFQWVSGAMQMYKNYKIARRLYNRLATGDVTVAINPTLPTVTMDPVKFTGTDGKQYATQSTVRFMRSDPEERKQVWGKLPSFKPIGKRFSVLSDQLMDSLKNLDIDSSMNLYQIDEKGKIVKDFGDVSVRQELAMADAMSAWLFSYHNVGLDDVADSMLGGAAMFIKKEEMAAMERTRDRIRFIDWCIRTEQQRMKEQFRGTPDPEGTLNLFLQLSGGGTATLRAYQTIRAEMNEELARLQNPDDPLFRDQLGLGRNSQTKQKLSEAYAGNRAAIDAGADALRAAESANVDIMTQAKEAKNSADMGSGVAASILNPMNWLNILGGASEPKMTAAATAEMDYNMLRAAVVQMNQLTQQIGASTQMQMEKQLEEIARDEAQRVTLQKAAGGVHASLSKGMAALLESDRLAKDAMNKYRLRPPTFNVAYYRNDKGQVVPDVEIMDAGGAYDPGSPEALVVEEKRLAVLGNALVEAHLHSAGQDFRYYMSSLASGSQAGLMETIYFQVASGVKALFGIKDAAWSLDRDAKAFEVQGRQLKAFTSGRQGKALGDYLTK